MTSHGSTESGVRIGSMLSLSARFENNVQSFRMLCFEKKNLEGLKHCTVMSLTNPFTIGGIPTLKDVERFLNGSLHEFCRLKVLTTLKQVNTSEEQSTVEKYDEKVIL